MKFRVTLHAQGTHAGYPYKGTGPIEALASIALSLQTSVTATSPPFHPLVLSVTEVHGGHVWNVVPAEAGFQGTVRYVHKSDGNLVGRRFKEVVEHAAEAYGISADVVWDDFQDPLVSDPGLAKAVAADVNDYAQLEPIRQSMAGEDFCEFAKVTLPGVRVRRVKRPGRLRRLGIARISWVSTNPFPTFVEAATSTPLCACSTS